ncbi:MAG: hypothetical protein J7J98_09000 [candidate division Zixibacteria bacterium]|nr:hypothetical protein [candidate division Zixibacteria bacterium]
MFKFDSRLVFIISVIGLLMVALSCSQTDDVTATKSVTKVWLTAERLPSAAVGMIYELWASKVDPRTLADPSDAQSLGRFSYINSDTLVAFTNDSGEIRADSNLFRLDGDLFDYEYLFVAAQNLDSVDEFPGPVMLLNPIAGNSDTLRLYFPKHDSLFDATIRCNFETPTDGHSGADGFGLWFSAYNFIQKQIDDTLGVDISYVDSTIYPIYDADSNILNLATLYAEYADSVWAEFDTILLDFGRDTLALGVTQTEAPLSTGHLHYGAKRHIIYRADSTQIPRTIKSYTIEWDTVPRYVNLDIFTQALYELPDLSMYGWEYKGWVVSDEIYPTAIGEFTPPAWDFISGELIIPGYQGGLISTGTFTDVTKADNSNPFTREIWWEVDSVVVDTVAGDTTIFRDSVLKRPNLPGEDFLDGAALSAATGGVISSSLDLFPVGDMSDKASVFVTIEPTNRFSDSTNFPLIAFSFRFPSSHNFGYPYYWPLINWTGTASGANGFPKITARIQRL